MRGQTPEREAWSVSGFVADFYGPGGGASGGGAGCSGGEVV
jgi:hypothetical protein